MYETILDYQYYSKHTKLGEESFTTLIPNRRLNKQGWEREEPSIYWSHWVDRESYDKKFSFNKNREPYKTNREKFDISPRDIFIKAYLTEYKDIRRVRRILSAIDTAIALFYGILR